MKKGLRVVLLIVVLAAAAAIPASTQSLRLGRASDETGEASLEMLVLVNRLDLSREQMEALHGTITGLLTERAAQSAMEASFRDEMIAWNGTNDELEARLVAFRDERIAAGAALRDTADAAIDEVKNVLSIAQGEILAQYAPVFAARVLGDRPTPVAARGMAEAAERPIGTVIERMRDRMGAAQHETMPNEAAPVQELLGRVRERMANQHPAIEGTGEAREEAAASMKDLAVQLRERLLGRSEESATPRLGTIARPNDPSVRPIQNGQAAVKMTARISERTADAVFAWLEDFAAALELKLGAVP